jgi:dienelactone hydrolase
MKHDPLDDFAESSSTYDGETKTVFRKGSGPAVIVIAEIPGITPEVADFARRVVDIGCTVAMPSLFGTPGKEMTGAYAANSIARACISREFVSLGTNKTSPVTVWLRRLAADLHDECGGPGVGAIGMCFTGGFALAMMVDPVVVAPVLSQPSLPLPLGKKRQAALGISDADLRIVKDRVADGCEVLGLRFTNDPVVRAARFETLRRELGDGFIGVEIDSSPSNPHGIKKGAHSVVTNDLVDEEGHPTRDALDQVLEHFRTRLQIAR